MAIDWSQYKDQNQLSTSGINWSQYKTTTQPENETNFWGGVKTFVTGLTKLPKTVAASVLQATQGKKGASVTDKDWADRFISNVAQDINKFVEETKGKYGEAKMLPGVPFKITDIASLPQNLGYSIASMGAGAAAAVPTALTGAIPLAMGAGGVASGAMAYSMTTYQIMQQYLEAKDQEKRAKTGKGLTKEEEAKLKDYFDKKATEYGLWEAVPEGLSNLIFAGAWSKPFLAALQKTAGKSIASKVAGAVLKTYASELATETVTQKGQSAIEAEVGLREGKIGWTDAFKEVFPQTFLLTSVMAGAGSATIPIAKARAKIQSSLSAEAERKKIPTTSPIYQEIKKAVDEGIKQAQETPTTQPESELEPLYQEARKYKTAEEFVKAQGTPVYHGGEISKLENKPLFTAVDDYIAKSYDPYGKLNEFYPNKNIKELDITTDYSKAKEAIKSKFDNYGENYVENTWFDPFSSSKKKVQETYDKYISKYKNFDAIEKRYDTLKGESVVSEYEKLWGKDVQEAISYIRKLPEAQKEKVFEFDILDRVIKEVKDPSRDDIYANWKQILKYAKDNKYDSVKHITQSKDAQQTGIERIFIDPTKSLKTKSQLIDIWNEANKTKTQSQPQETPTTQPEAQKGVPEAKAQEGVLSKFTFDIKKIKYFGASATDIKSPNGRLLFTQDNGEAFIQRMVVADKAQGKGEGTALVQKAIELAQQQGLNKITIETASEGSRRIAQKLGFTPTTENGRFYVKDIAPITAPKYMPLRGEQFPEEVKTMPAKESGVARGFAEKAIKKGITDLPDLATYESSTIKEQTRLMKEFFDKGGIEIAGDILDGKIPLPQGIKPLNFLDELEKYISQNPKQYENLIPKIVSSPLASAGSEAGSILGLAQQRKGTFAQRVQEIHKARENLIGEKIINQAKSEAKKAAKTNYLTKEEASWKRFIDELPIC